MDIIFGYRKLDEGLFSVFYVPNDGLLKGEKVKFGTIFKDGQEWNGYELGKKTPCVSSKDRVTTKVLLWNHYCKKHRKDPNTGI